MQRMCIRELAYMVGGAIAGVTLVSLVSLSNSATGGRDREQGQAAHAAPRPVGWDEPNGGGADDIVDSQILIPGAGMELPLDPYSSPTIWVTEELLENFDLDVLLLQEEIQVAESWSALLGLDDSDVVSLTELLERFNGVFRTLDLTHRRVTEESDDRTAFVIDSYGDEGESIRQEFEGELVNLIGLDRAKMFLILAKRDLKEIFYDWGKVQREFELTPKGDSFELKVLKGGAGNRMTLTGDKLPFLLRHLGSLE